MNRLITTTTQVTTRQPVDVLSLAAEGGAAGVRVQLIDGLRDSDVVLFMLAIPPGECRKVTFATPLLIRNLRVVMPARPGAQVIVDYEDARPA